jgi:uncharacterized protein (DUF1684 family)
LLVLPHKLQGTENRLAAPALTLWQNQPLWVNCGMKSTLSALLLLAALATKSQTRYADSLYEYQAKYKKDLVEIIHSDTGYVRFYAPDAAYRIMADVELLKDQKWFGMRTSDGRSHRARKYARVTFNLNGKIHHLFAYQLEFLLNSKDNADDFFIPFLDAGSGELTYGGGRYLDFKTGDVVSNKLLIDFNKAYNPYCAFTTGYSCPIPPRENTLETTVAAGEKAFAKAKH